MKKKKDVLHLTRKVWLSRDYGGDFILHYRKPDRHGEGGWFNNIEEVFIGAMCKKFFTTCGLKNNECREVEITLALGPRLKGE